MTYLAEKKKWLVLLAFFFVPFWSEASCGNITFIDYGAIDWGDPDFELDSAKDTAPIDNCDNPFNADATTGYTPLLDINDTAVADGDTVTLTPDQPANLDYSISPPDYGSFFSVDLYQKTDSGYEIVTTSFELEMFPDGLPAGEYVAVFISSTLFFNDHSQPTWLRLLKEFFLPTTALAFYADSSEVATISFTIKHDAPEPTGASSVLFLPGIMGSRLYEESEVCGNEIEIQERWFSRDECDHLRMKTTFLGKSINEIFTDIDQSSIVDETLGFNLYKSFLSHMADLEEAGEIEEFVALPYDWRLMLEDVAKSSLAQGRVTAAGVGSINEGVLYQTIEELAEDSLSGKVSIVAHSNGGLLSKYFLDTLEKSNDPLLAKIDNLFLVGVPQTGTPESVISILHGSAIGGGFVLDQAVARELVNNMPAIRHLMPSETYFASDLAADFPVISFQAGELTDVWIEEFGAEIKDLDQLHRFVGQDSGRAKPETEDLLQPEVVDNFLLDYAKVTHTIQSNWEPPAGLMVHQLAGSGVSTPVGLTYFTDLECTSRNLLLGFKCTEYAPKLGYRVTQVDAGDGTVAFPSAGAMSHFDEMENILVDLKKYNEENLIGRVHRNMLEIDEIQNYIENSLKQAEGSVYDYLLPDSAPSQSEPKISFQLHSPLDMKLVAGGLEVSSSTSEITNATYQRYGEVQYISIPKSIGQFELVLVGLREGSFTLEVEEWQGSNLLKRHDFVAVPTGPETRVFLNSSDTNELPTTFNLDYDGDGEIDAVVSEDGSVVSVVPDEIVEEEAEDLVVRQNTATYGTRVDRSGPTGEVAGISVQANSEEVYLQQLADLLTEMSRLLTLLGKM